MSCTSEGSSGTDDLLVVGVRLEKGATTSLLQTKHLLPSGAPKAGNASAINGLL
jgi:hypothetical protein